MTSEISRSIVQLHAELYGRGPTKAKTYMDPDYALCVLEEVFNPGEHTLIEHGNPEQVSDTRAAFQDAVSDRFVAMVERVTGRKVRAFISQVHTDANVAAELFLFEGDEGSPGAESAEAPVAVPQPEA